MTYVIGIDGGGTKTKATSFDPITGKTLFSVQTGPANFSVQYQASIEQVTKSIQLCIEQMGGMQPERILLGASGAHSKEICQRIEVDLVQTFNGKLAVIDDAQLAHTALLQGKDGILIIAGTGSIALGRYYGEEWRTGGWGYLLGDEGSGYWISIKALQFAMSQLEGKNSHDILTRAILNSIKGQNMSDIKSFVYAASKQEIAKLSELVYDVAQKNGEPAISILREAGEQLAQLVKRALTNPNSLHSQMKIAVSGSLLLKNDIVYDSFENIMKQEFPKHELVREDRNVCEGVLYS
ncbi:BadF/BadG/BcrA/BcrD ATPase family protein [Paenibacillus sp. BSR1-1]|uniref:N-acetylglucosamine kinase n=1 Tax=Paenibacillus sp. BSR1-1 TaxID=3020845 RepID=UPI0025B02F19|nr:BadF/BadG/BcrA/BcrD ATPase family protein [Paenibacillus sp. BSR1-1]MDN3020077.1 BadF/BadG/BcrA/BcrD ATPase family protein [Paenibacillus sp. BSR1-1]